jgi:outer membrane protein assembly factor BamD
MLCGCAEKDEYVEKPVEDLYNDAMDSFENKSFKKAAKSFAEVERQHPYSNWALKAQLMSAYAYYACKMYNDAIEGFNVFIQLHPGHPDVAYAYYMLGLCHYEQIPIVERDQKPSEDALSAFSEVTARFADSPYAKDAKFKMDMVRDHLAAKEMDTGHFYQKRGSYLAAIKRFKTVVDQYQTTTHIPEALHRLVECYLALGVNDEVKRIAAVLGHNYPDNTWYQATYALLQAKAPELLA